MYGLRVRSEKRRGGGIFRYPAVLLLLFLASPAMAQDLPAEQAQQGPQAQQVSQYPASMNVALSNLGRVGASASEIEAVLREDPGLMVELKRWVALRATELGQILRDDDLTDGAIYSRLESDAELRAAATRLLQRYGYLLPQLNPASEKGQERAMLLKERAIQLARAEEQGRAAPVTASEKAPAAPSTPSQVVQVIVPGGAGSVAGPAPVAPVTTPSPTQEILTQLGLPSLPGSPAAVLASTTPPPTPSSAAVSGEDPDVLAGISQPAVYSPPARPRGGSGSSASPALTRQGDPFANVPSLFDMYLQAGPAPTKLTRFGEKVFLDTTASDQLIPMDLPVGPDYVLGPGDGLTIDLWGSVSERLLRVVDRTGRVNLPEVGPLLVSGRTLGDVQQDVQRILGTHFREISADVSLTRLRTVRVYVVGDVEHPGAYDVSSLSTPLNALFAAGGPTRIGSLRVLEHWRAGKLLQTVDVYDLLLHGVPTDILNLQNGDTVRVPTMGPQVTVEGMVRRPAIYELHEEKDLAQVLHLAGGILPAAALRHIEVDRLIAHQKRTMLSFDVSHASDPAAIETQLASFHIQDGDIVNVFPVAPYNQEAVYLEGHVVRPGKYAYHPGMKLPDLIASYKDLLPMPASYAEIIRLSPPDFHPVVESFNLLKAMANPAVAPMLEPLDTVRIYSQYAFEDAPVVSVGGAVRKPGMFRTSGQIHLRDAIQLAGGVTPDADLSNAQVFHYLPKSWMEVTSVNLEQALQGNPIDNILLGPRDLVVVHASQARVNPATVYVQGEVAHPARYPLGVNMRLSDLVRASGGLKPSADTATADLTRFVVGNSSPLAGEHEEIELGKALAGDASENIVLRNGDVLTIRELPGWNDIGASVTVEGEVRHPGGYGIQPGERLSSVLERAGGFLPTAYPEGIVFEREDVRKMQQESRQQLIQEIRQQASTFKTSLNTSAADQAQLQQAAYTQAQQAIATLEQAPVTGRMVIQMTGNLKRFQHSPDNVVLRAGDRILIPKRPSFVAVTGQVYNANAITFVPHRTAGWYLRQAGGATPQANMKDIFIVRANGSVVSGGSHSWMLHGGVLSTVIEPGDTIIVPQKAVGGSTVWKNVLAVAQLASSAAIVSAITIP